MRWGGDRLSQTRPIPRSPDGDNKNLYYFSLLPPIFRSFYSYKIEFNSKTTIQQKFRKIRRRNIVTLVRCCHVQIWVEEVTKTIYNRAFEKNHLHAIVVWRLYFKLLPFVNFFFPFPCPCLLNLMF